MFPPPRSVAARVVHPATVVVSVLTLLLLATSSANANLHDTGAWSPTYDLGFIPVHMVHVQGDGATYFSRILMWDDDGNGAEMGWSPGTAGCSDWPTGFSVVSGTWTPGADIFCAGHTGLAEGGGAVLTSGGDENLGSVHRGISDARIYVPEYSTSVGEWTPVGPMHQERFYPTTTLLRDGRVLVTGGRRSPQLWFFGGRRDGNAPASSPGGDSLFRIGTVSDAQWNFSNHPQPDPNFSTNNRPEPREGHTAVRMASTLSAQAIYGGKNGSGVSIGEQSRVWLLRRTNGSATSDDYVYTWERLTPGGSSSPSSRSEHAAITNGDGTEMLIFGGINEPSSGTPTVNAEIWRLFKTTGGQWQWSQLNTDGGPGPRYGHTAVYDAAASRMIVFGGSSSAGADPESTGVWALNFDTGTFASPSGWERLNVQLGSGYRPLARRDHVMVLDANSPSGGRSLVLFGGYISSSTASDTVWTLNLAASTLAWSPLSVSGTHPSPRQKHAAYYDADHGNGRLIIVGGDPTSTTEVDGYEYTIEPFASSPTWTQRAYGGPHLSNQSMGVDNLTTMTYARNPEIFNPTTSTWSLQVGSGLLPPEVEEIEDLPYPVQFAMPASSAPPGGGRVYQVGPDSIARYLDIPATGATTGWTNVTTGTSASSGFFPFTGVMYEPGKIMIAGGLESAPGSQDPVITGKTRRIDLSNSSGWQTEPSMATRNRHNLVLLPNGQVLAVGGIGAGGPEMRPQIWTPGTPGSWTDPDLLESDTIIRDYHSTAILLPDARVLTGGGNAVLDPAKKLKIFCPPYLFDAQGNLATRPSITSVSSTSITYGQAFVITTSSASSIAKVTLIRPAATTHSFDENQRYLRVSFEVLPDNSGLRCVAPTLGGYAPPGDYLLFILDGNDVPSIASWIKLGSCSSVPCDTDSPPVTNSLSVDIIGSTEVWLLWTAPGDDTSPVAGEYDLRRATSAITSENAFAAATPSTDEPSVQSAGNTISCVQDSLTACTSYSFALKTRDGVNNWSKLGTDLSVTTSCGGGGGGFMASRVIPGAEPFAGAPQAHASNASATSLGRSPSLIAETQRAADGSWKVTVRTATEPGGISPGDAGSIVSQVSDAHGGWITLGRYQPGADQDRLGVCALRPGGRIVLPPGFTVDRVTGSLRSGSQVSALATANHSRLGDLGEAAATAESLSFAAGDSLTLRYARTESSTNGATGWYLRVRPGLIPGGAQSARREPAAEVPEQFMLYANHPNPFRESTMIPFDLPREAPVHLEVFDLLGRRVATIADRSFPAGAHAIEWNLRGSDGNPLRPGIYIYRLTAGEFRARRKMTLMP